MTAGNYRSTLGGACSALGTFLMGIGVTGQFNGSDTPLVKDITLAGFIMLGLGQFFGHLFAADAKSVAGLTDDVADLKEAVQSNTTAISKK